MWTASMLWWKHAFALEEEGPALPTPEQQVLVDALCRRIVERGLALPALLFLESCQPLGPLAAQSLLLLQPWFELVVDRRELTVLIPFLERRGSLETICRRLETFMAERSAGESVPSHDVPPEGVRAQ